MSLENQKMCCVFLRREGLLPHKRNNNAFKSHEKAETDFVGRVSAGRCVPVRLRLDAGSGPVDVEGRFRAGVNQFHGIESQGAGHKAGCGQEASHRGGALLDALQPVPSRALSHRADGGAMENHHASHAGAREYSRGAVETDPAIPPGQQRSLSTHQSLEPQMKKTMKTRRLMLGLMATICVMGMALPPRAAAQVSLVDFDA